MDGHAGKVIKPDTFMNIKDEGMPVHGRPYMKGNLYVHFVVEFPATMDASQVRCHPPLNSNDLC